jgi:class 3 adenylate cyclase
MRLAADPQCEVLRGMRRKVQRVAAPAAQEPASRGDGSAERRQVTILFADIAGYTRMSTSLDPEELHVLLGRY